MSDRELAINVVFRVSYVCFHHWAYTGMSQNPFGKPEKISKYNKSQFEFLV